MCGREEGTCGCGFLYIVFQLRLGVLHTIVAVLLSFFFFSFSSLLFSMQSSVVGGNEDKKSVNEGALARMDLFSVELNRGTVRI